MRHETVKAPSADWHPNRDIECRRALKPALGALVERAKAAGWTSLEISSALLSLACENAERGQSRQRGLH